MESGKKELIDVLKIQNGATFEREFKRILSDIRSLLALRLVLELIDKQWDGIPDHIREIITKQLERRESDLTHEQTEVWKEISELQGLLKRYDDILNEKRYLEKMLKKHSLIPDDEATLVSLFDAMVYAPSEDLVDDDETGFSI